MVNTSADVQAEFLVQPDIALGKNPVVIGSLIVVLIDEARRRIEVLLALLEVPASVGPEGDRVFVGDGLVHLHLNFYPASASDVVVYHRAIWLTWDHVEEREIRIEPIPIVTAVGLHIPTIAELFRVAQIDERLPVGFA